MSYQVIMSTIGVILFILMMIIFIVGLGVKSYILYLDKKLEKYDTTKQSFPTCEDVEKELKLNKTYM